MTLQDFYALMIRQLKELQIRARKSGGKGNQGNSMFAMVRKDGVGTAGEDDDELVPGTDGRIVENECYICRKKGNISWYCLEAGNTGPPPRSKQNLNCEKFAFVQSGKNVGDKEVIYPELILLDMCSTVSVCCNQDLVRDIKKCKDDEVLTIVYLIYVRMNILYNKYLLLNLRCFVWKYYELFILLSILLF